MQREGGGQFTSNLGPGWTRIAPRKEERFQVSKRDSGKKGSCRGKPARGISNGNLKGLRHGLALSICVYVS
jgi:hypothetical protein